MRIGFVYDPAFPWIIGGGEKSVYELGRELRERGHEIHFFSMQCWDGPRDIVREGMHYHGLCPNLPLYDDAGRRSLIQPLRFAWGVLTRLPRYRLNEFHVIDIHAFPFFSIPAFWVVRSLFARRLPWIETWLEVWGRDYWRRYLGWKGAVGAWVERLCARLGKHHLCISETTAGRLRVLLKVPERSIHVVPRGFRRPDAGPFDTPKSSAVAIVVGRLLDYKRVDLVIRAWPGVVAQIPTAVLEIVGDGPQLAALDRLAADLCPDRGVRFLGRPEAHEDVMRRIASATLLLQPSTREGQSLVVLESLWLGTPVLAASGPETAVPEFVGGGVAAEWSLLPIDDGPEAWARRIVELFRREDLRREIAEIGHASVADLDWSCYIAPRIEALYESLQGPAAVTDASR